MSEMTGEHPTSLSRVSTRVKEWVHTHTPEGRKEEYLSKWNHVMEGVSGLPRFELESRLNDEAGKYARDRVLRDVFVVAATATGATVGAVGIIELKNRNWQMGKLFSDLGAKATNWTKDTMTNTASAATKLGIEGATKAITENPDLIAGLASRATEQAATGVQEAIASPVVNSTLQLAGHDAVAALTDGAMKAVEAQASAAPEHVKAGIFTAFLSLLSRVTGKK